MVKDAESHAEEDKQRREEIDTRNRLDSLAYEVEKNSKEWSEKLSPAAISSPPANATSATTASRARVNTRDGISVFDR
jgi:molecular chaperone DnaK